MSVVIPAMMDGIRDLRQEKTLHFNLTCFLYCEFALIQEAFLPVHS